MGDEEGRELLEEAKKRAERYCEEEVRKEDMKRRRVENESEEEAKKGQ